MGSRQRGDIDPSWSSLHDGISGQNQTQLLTQLIVNVMPIGPEIVLYLCGVNDLIGGSTPAQAITALQTNLDAIFSRAYRLIAVVLGELIPNGDSTLNGKINTFNGLLPAVAAAYTAAGKRVVIAPLNAAVPYTTPNFGGDQTHPNPTGYQAMAVQGWLPTLLPLLP